MSSVPASSAAAGNASASAKPSNLVEVTSPEHFTDLMQQDLERVSLLNFWAPWAEPCKQMNEVVEELAAKYPNVLCLVVSIPSPRPAPCSCLPPADSTLLLDVDVLD